MEFSRNSTLYNDDQVTRKRCWQGDFRWRTNRCRNFENSSPKQFRIFDLPFHVQKTINAVDEFQELRTTACGDERIDDAPWPAGLWHSGTMA